MSNLLAFASEHGFEIFGTAVVLGLGSKYLLPLLAGFQTQLDNMLHWGIKLVFVSKQVADVSTQRIVYQYLNGKTRGYGNMEDMYEAMYDHIRPLDRRQAYFVRFMWQTWRLWFLRGVPIIMVPPGSEEKPQFVYLRGTIDWNKLVMDACQWQYERDNEEKKDKEQPRRFKIIHMRGNSGGGLNALVGKLNAAKDETAPAPAPDKGSISNYDIIGWRPEDIGPDRPENPTANLSMNANMLEAEKQVDFWLSHQEWYKERGIPWKMGLLLYGPPGTGKTSLVRAIALKLDLPVYVFDLSTMNSRDFVEAWGSMRSDPTKIVLLEDIDTVFHGRKNVITDHKLSFEVVLNTIDGIDEEDGILLVVTTNLVEEVDEALGRPDENGDSTRGGRIDLTLEIGKLDEAGRHKIADRILKDPDLATEMAAKYTDDTPVMFRERCRKLAINMLWGRA